jgi:hypothetical protein
MADASNHSNGPGKVWVALTALAAIAVGIGMYFFRSPQEEGARSVIVRIARAFGRLVGKEDRARKPIGVVVQEIEHADEVQRAHTIIGLRYELTEPAEFVQVFPSLIRAATDESEMVRNAVTSVLDDLINRFGRNAPGTNHREPTIMAPDPKFEESLAGLLNDSSPKLRASAAGFLRTLAAIRQLDAPDQVRRA